MARNHVAEYVVWLLQECQLQLTIKEYNKDKVTGVTGATGVILHSLAVRLRSMTVRLRSMTVSLRSLTVRLRSMIMTLSILLVLLVFYR